MKNTIYIITRLIYSILGVLLFITHTRAQQANSDDLINLLIQHRTITQHEADSLRAEQAIKQQENLKDKEFTVDFELRNRSEYRNGYAKPLVASTAAIKNANTPAFFTEQRSRLGFGYKYKGKLDTRLSFQDLRVWGGYDSRSLIGSVQLFEAYAEPYFTPEWSVRIGRQRVVFDNQRLFAENDWRLNANAHDAVNIKYRGDNLTSDLVFAFNQNFTPGSTTLPSNGTVYNTYDTSLYPSGRPYYKALAVSYLKYDLNKKLTIGLLNAYDSYQATTTIATTPEKVYGRYTNGGRIEYQSGDWYATIASYYQWGKNQLGNKIDAFYVQPELRYGKVETILIRLGAEILSGDNLKTNDPTKNASLTDHSFDPLYGVAHRFNGNIDFFTDFAFSAKGNHLKQSGLINPYLFVAKRLASKWVVKSDFHAFYSYHNYYDTSKKITYDKYLGFEQDLGLAYKPNNYLSLEAGYSYYLATNATEAIRGTSSNINSGKHFSDWAYISISVKPQIFKSLFK